MNGIKMIAAIFVTCFALSSALPYGFNSFSPYRGGYGFGHIGGAYSSFPGFGGGISAFPSYPIHKSVNYHSHSHIQPYGYSGYNGRGYFNNFLGGSTLPSLALGFLVGRHL